MTSHFRFRKLVRGNEWHCTIQAIPDLLHPEQEGYFEAHAYQDNADMAKDARLQPGDRAMMRGTVQQQTVVLENGATTSFNHLYVTFIEAPSVPVSLYTNKGKEYERWKQGMIRRITNTEF